MSIDTISNMLSSLRNASMSGLNSVEIPYFRQGKDILEVFKNRGLVSEVKTFKPEDTANKFIHVDLVTLENGERRILETRRISKPGSRVTKPYPLLFRVKGGFGVLVVSTSRGIMDAEEARRKKLGGEVICSCYFK